MGTPSDMKVLEISEAMGAAADTPKRTGAALPDLQRPVEEQVAEPVGHRAQRGVFPAGAARVLPSQAATRSQMAAFTFFSREAEASFTWMPAWMRSQMRARPEDRRLDLPDVGHQGLE